MDIIEDMTLAKNECMIETDNGIFDCGLGTELSELKTEAGSSVLVKGGIKFADAFSGFGKI